MNDANRSVLNYRNYMLAYFYCEFPGNCASIRKTGNPLVIIEVHHWFLWDRGFLIEEVTRALNI